MTWGVLGKGNIDYQGRQRGGEIIVRYNLELPRIEDVRVGMLPLLFRPLRIFVVERAMGSCCNKQMDMGISGLEDRAVIIRFGSEASRMGGSR